MRKHTILIILVLFFSNRLVTQNLKYIDSLKNQLSIRQNNDSIKLVILTKLHESLMFSKPEEARQYALQELELYEQSGLEFAYGLGNLHLGDYYYNKTKNDSAKHYYTLAKNSFLKNGKAKGLIFVNYTIAEIFKTEGNYVEALNIFNESIAAIDKHIHDPYYISQFKGGSYLAI